MKFVSELSAWGIKRGSVYPSSSFEPVSVGPRCPTSVISSVFPDWAGVRPQCVPRVGSLREAMVGVGMMRC